MARFSFAESPVHREKVRASRIMIARLGLYLALFVAIQVMAEFGDISTRGELMLIGTLCAVAAYRLGAWACLMREGV